MRFDSQFPDFGFGVWYTGADGMMFPQAVVTCMIAWWVVECELPVLRGRRG